MVLNIVWSPEQLWWDHLKLMRNSDSQASLHACWIRNSGSGAIWSFPKPDRRLWCPLPFEKHSSSKLWAQAMECPFPCDSTQCRLTSFTLWIQYGSLHLVLWGVLSVRGALFWWPMPTYVAAMMSLCSLLPPWGQWNKDLCIGDSSSSPASALNSHHWVVTPCLFSKQVLGNTFRCVYIANHSFWQRLGGLPSDELCECLPLGLDFSAKVHTLIPPRYCLGFSATAVLSLKNVVNWNRLFKEHRR